ncbi:MAG: TadE/TadG family type IV pilus assembly protein [bacterium]|nr:TadE/TadG family type IV pilus assembly protein [bacterium]
MEKGREKGQSTVEFALLLPLLLLVALLTIEVSLVLHNYLIVTQLSREAARAVALGSKTDNEITADIMTNPSWLANTHFLTGTISRISILPVAADRQQGGTITVSIPYRVSIKRGSNEISLPYFGKPINLTMTATTTMRIER